MKDQVQIGVIGLGSRGMGLMTSVMLEMEDVVIAAVCDLSMKQCEEAARKVREKRGNVPFCTSDYYDILADDGIDGVVVCTSWESHMKIALDAMRAGKYVGMEVGGAYSLEECWKLVQVYEETGIPCMMLENCCYGREEMMTLHMVKQGVLGEIVQCEGGYCHDIRKETVIDWGEDNFRMRNYLLRNCENYPTHELGPIAQVLDINRGNRMLTLTSVSSKSAGLHEFISRARPDSSLCEAHFAQGDVVTTTIRCARGETITITLADTLPRPYSRRFLVQGTKGIYQDETRSLFLDGVHNSSEFKWQEQWNNIEKYREQYEHPMWKKYLASGIESGHEGTDWLVLRAYFDSVKNQTQTPIDVYDAAAWMSVSVLSEQSVSMNGAPTVFPDFTNGRWITRT